MAAMRFSMSRVVRESGSVAETANSSAISSGPTVPAASSRFCVGASFSATSELITIDRVEELDDRRVCGVHPLRRVGEPDVLDLPLRAPPI